MKGAAKKRPKGDHKHILEALRRAAQKRGVQDFCRRSQIGSTTIYSATHPETGNPSLRTLVRIVNALGYELTVKAKAGKRDRPQLPVGTEAVLNAGAKV